MLSRSNSGDQELFDQNRSQTRCQRRPSWQDNPGDKYSSMKTIGGMVEKVHIYLELKVERFTKLCHFRWVIVVPFSAFDTVLHQWHQDWRSTSDKLAAGKVLKASFSGGEEDPFGALELEALVVVFQGFFTHHANHQCLWQVLDQPPPMCQDLVDGGTHLCPVKVELIEGDQPFTLFFYQLWIQWYTAPEESPKVDQAFDKVPLPLVVLHTKGGNHKV